MCCYYVLPSPTYLLALALLYFLLYNFTMLYGVGSAVTSPTLGDLQPSSLVVLGASPFFCLPFASLFVFFAHSV